MRHCRAFDAATNVPLLCAFASFFFFAGSRRSTPLFYMCAGGGRAPVQSVICLCLSVSALGHGCFYGSSFTFVLCWRVKLISDKVEFFGVFNKALCRLKVSTLVAANVKKD